MKNSVLFTHLTFLLALFSLGSPGQTALYSVIVQRKDTLSEFRRIEDSLKIPSRGNLLMLIGKAKSLIAMDDRLISYYLEREIQNNRLLAEKAEQLSFEVSLLQKEAEINKILSDERGYIQKIMLIGLLVTGCFFIVALILFIDRQIRYRSIKLELDRTWPLMEVLQKDEPPQSDVHELKQKILMLQAKNLDYETQIMNLSQKMKANEESFANELNSKKQIEEEIRKLITRLKEISA